VVITHSLKKSLNISSEWFVDIINKMNVDLRSTFLRNTFEEFRLQISRSLRKERGDYLSSKGTN